MSNLVTIELFGASELNKVIKKLPGELADKVYLQALRKGSNLVRDSARERAPYGTNFSKRSFTRSKKGVQRTELFKLRDQIKVTVTLKTGVSFAMAVHIGAAYWGMFQEFGTSKMPARPWMRPAFDAAAQDALNLIGTELGKGVERTAVRLAGPLSKSRLLKRY